ncbi:zinc finger protein 770-like [Osmerus mordax]|uniref:zinc finger protein 770-like n=1 Tax=Osmerus mordax TaxID=8014 RepID=UPI003510A3D0
MHQCTVCSKSFPSASKLERHHFTHTGQKPFTCTVCDKGFRQSVHLKKHIETHTGKSNPWSFPTESLQHGSFPNPMEPVSTRQDQPSPDKSGHDFNIYNTMPLQPTRPMFSQTQEAKERMPLSTGLSPTEMRHQPELLPSLIDNGFISQQNILSNSQFLPNPMFHDPMGASTAMGSSQSAAGFWHTDQGSTAKKHTCTVCLKSFNSSYHLQRHIPTHSQLKPFECETCGKAFKQKAHLKSHSQSHHSAGFSEDPPVSESQQGSSAGKMRVNHQCPTCLKTFCSPSKLKRHFMIHTGQKPYSCGDCGKSFRQVWHLKTHLYAHRCAGTGADVKSETNGQSLNGSSTSQPAGDQKSSAPSNPVTSSVEMELQCEISVRTPPGHDQLETTDQSPNDVKVEQQGHASNHYQCSICSKTFSSLSKHRQHYATHKELRPFQCQVCNRAFRLAVHLKRHQISHKNPDEEFQNQSLSETPGKALLDPVNSHQHPNNGMASTQPSDGHAPHLSVMVKPENARPKPSDEQDCALQGTDPSLVSEQQAGSGQANSQQQKIRHRPHSCPTCLKRFPSPSKLQRHMMTHTGQRPFGCESCGKRFRQLSHLRIHSRTHLWTKYYKQKLPLTTKPSSASVDNDSPNEAALKQSEQDTLSERQFGQPSTGAVGWNENNSKKQGFQHATPSPFRPQRKTFASTRQRHTCHPCGKTFPLLTQYKLHICSNPGLQGKDNLDCGPFTSQQTASNSSGLSEPNRCSKTATKRRKSTNPVGNPVYTRHQCLICYKYFPSFSKLERHSRVHTDLRPYNCLACGKTFRQATHLTVHERTHNKFGPLRPTSQQATTSHVKAQPQKQHPLQYPKIHIQVPQMSAMKTDLRPSKSTKEWVGMQGNYEDSLHNQENTHHENKQAMEINEKSSPDKTNKLANPRIKSKGAGDKRKGHVCTICQKGFDTPSKLSRHFLIHTGLRPFKCSFCSKAFRQVWHRRNHERTHESVLFSNPQDNNAQESPENYPTERHGSGSLSEGPTTSSEGDAHREEPRPRDDSPDPCSVTNEAVSGHPTETRDNKCVDFHSLPAHTMDFDNKPGDLYQCPECHNVYQTPSELASHLEAHWRVSTQDLLGPPPAQHEAGSSTQRMGMAFPANRGLDDTDSREVFSERHSGSESSVGEIPLQAEMHYNDWSEPLRSFQCRKCLRSFALERDLQLHKCTSGTQTEATQSNQYQCAICFKNFVSPSKLKRHYVTHTGQRPYMCEVCDKTFTQSSHLKTHRHRSHKQ